MHINKRAVPELLLTMLTISMQTSQLTAWYAVKPQSRSLVDSLLRHGFKPCTPHKVKVEGYFGVVKTRMKEQTRHVQTFGCKTWEDAPSRHLDIRCVMDSSSVT